MVTGGGGRTGTNKTKQNQTYKNIFLLIPVKDIHISKLSDVGNVLNSHVALPVCPWDARYKRQRKTLTLLLVVFPLC